MLLWHFDLVAHLGMTEADSAVLKSLLNLFQVISKLKFDLIDSFVGIIELLINANLRLWNLGISPCHAFPLDEPIKL